MVNQSSEALMDHLEVVFKCLVYACGHPCAALSVVDSNDAHSDWTIDGQS